MYEKTKERERESATELGGFSVSFFEDRTNTRVFDPHGESSSWIDLFLFQWDLGFRFVPFGS